MKYRPAVLTTLFINSISSRCLCTVYCFHELDYERSRSSHNYATSARQITGEDRDQLMKLQYRIGKLEVDNMELEQSRIVHESAMRGKDLTIQKLQLQVKKC